MHLNLHHETKPKKPIQGTIPMSMFFLIQSLLRQTISIDKQFL